jgi:ADP-ribose pyrophosphatase YjhB (NUDIX family)
MTRHENHSVSVAGIVIDDGRALLIRRADTAEWQPPGGVLEHGETIEAGLRREIHEETGLTVQPEMLTGVYQHLPRGIVALVFRCRPIGGTLTPNAEAMDFRWVAATEAQALLTESFAVRVLDAFAPGRATAIRVHDGIRLL